jgi:hypothetical protein
MSGVPKLPRNFLDEVETALREARATLDDTSEHIAALDELHCLCRSLSYELGRPVTVFDVVLSAHNDADRAHRRELVRLLRAG